MKNLPFLLGGLLVCSPAHADWFPWSSVLAPSSVLSVEKGGTGLSSAGSTGECLISNGSGYTHGACGGGGSGLTEVFSPAIHHAYGDSITYGVGTTAATDNYVTKLSLAENSLAANYGVSGDQACDMADHVFNIADYSVPANNAPVYTILIGTNDAYYKSTGTYEAVFKNCLSAASAWLAIPDDYKINTNSASCTTSGTWNANGAGWAANVGKNTTSAGAYVSCPLTTTGGPVYVWWLANDSWTGSGTYQIDSGTPVSISAVSSPLVATHNSGTKGYFVARITGVSAGAHTIKFTNVSASTFAPLAAGTLPDASRTLIQPPRVFVAGLPYFQADASSSTTAAYYTDTSDAVAVLSGDGLPVSFVPLRNYINSGSDMYNTLHPGDAGHTKIKTAFMEAENFTPRAGRYKMGAARSLAVATTGTDAGDCIDGSTCKTIQRAVNALHDKVDLGGYTATVNVAAGTYAEGVEVRGPFVGATTYLGGMVYLKGDTTTPANVIIQGPGTFDLAASDGAIVYIGGFQFRAVTAGAGNEITADDKGTQVNVIGNIAFGGSNAAYGHVLATNGGIVTIFSSLANVTISVGATRGFRAEQGGTIQKAGVSITYGVGTTNYTIQDYATMGGLIYAENVVQTGTTTGQKCYAELNAIVNRNGMTGNAGTAGGTATGGQVVCP